MRKVVEERNLGEKNNEKKRKSNTEEKWLPREIFLKMNERGKLA